MPDDWTAARMYKVALACLLLAGAASALSGDARLAAWTLLLTLAFIFGVSGFVVSRHANDDEPIAADGVQVEALARWSFTAEEWQLCERARLDRNSYMKNANVAAWLIGVPVGALLWWTLGFEYGAPVVALFALLMPLSRAAQLWLFAPASDEVREIVITKHGFALGDAPHSWRDAQGGSNVTSVELHAGPPAMIELHHLADRDGSWVPARTLLPVPAGREAEARSVLEFLTALADEA